MKKMAFIATPFAILCLTACGGSSGGSETLTPAPTPASSSAPAPVQAAPKPAMSAMERGAVLYKRCRACHTLGEGEKHKVGPNLWGIYGLKAGSKEGFNYSKVMAASEVVWDDETLSAYIEKPSAYMPGNRMSFVGIKKDEDRAALLEYLRAETGG